ncbi:MAG: hypothetical protein GX287_00095 [Fusobacteria bacterium]|nr:hypothetical protein [Fusobacteriota bacterium]
MNIKILLLSFFILSNIVFGNTFYMGVEKNKSNKNNYYYGTYSEYNYPKNNTNYSSQVSNSKGELYPNLYFYPVSLAFDSLIFGIEIPIYNSMSVDLGIGHYKYIEDRETITYEIGYKLYEEPDNTGLYFGFYGGYKDITERKNYKKEKLDSLYMGIQAGFKYKFNDNLSISNGINYSYSEYAHLHDDINTNFILNADLMRIHLSF